MQPTILTQTPARTPAGTKRRHTPARLVNECVYLTDDVARILGCKAKTVRMLVKSGRLIACKVGRSYAIDGYAVRAFLHGSALVGVPQCPPEPNRQPPPNQTATEVDRDESSVADADGYPTPGGRVESQNGFDSRP